MYDWKSNLSPVILIGNQMVYAWKSLVFCQILEQLNLSKTATWGTEIGAIVERFKQEPMSIICPRGQKKWPL